MARKRTETILTGDRPRARKRPAGRYPNPRTSVDAAVAWLEETFPPKTLKRVLAKTAKRVGVPFLTERQYEDAVDGAMADAARREGGKPIPIDKVRRMLGFK